MAGAATTAWTARLWIGRHTAHPAAAWVGGLLVGFGPFVGGHAIMHLNFVLLPLVPVMLMLVEDLLWRHPRPQWRTGLLLGAVTAAQGMLSEEVVMILATGVVAATAAALGLRPAQTWATLRQACAGLAIAVTTFLVLLGYQLYVARPDLALAVLAAVFVDVLLTKWAEGNRRSRQIGLLAATAGAVATVMPAAVPPGSPARVPAFFTSDTTRVVPEGAAVLVLPYSGAGAAAPMLWQAVSGMHFRMAGGYAIHPERPRPGFGAYPDAITSVFRTASQGGRVSRPAQLAAARRLLIAHHIGLVLLDRYAPQAVRLRRTVRAVLGRGPSAVVGGMLIWKVEPATPGPRAA